MATHSITRPAGTSNGMGVIHYNNASFHGNKQTFKVIKSHKRSYDKQNLTHISNHNPDLFVNIEVISTFSGGGGDIMVSFK